MKRSLLAALAFVSVCQAADPDPVPKAVQDTAPGIAHVMSIQTAWESGDEKGAKADIRRWMKSDDKSAWPWVAGANIKFHEKKYGGCISMADGALKRDPNSADAYYWRGRCLESKGKVLEAANEYGAALEAQPLHLAAQEGRNRLRAQLGETPADVQPN